MKWSAIFLLPAAMIAACHSGPSQAQGGQSAGLARFEGMWEVMPRGPRPGLGPRAGKAGDRRGLPPGPAGAGAPPPFGAGPPPEGDGRDLPGPDIEGLDRGDRMTWSMMTAAGRAAFAAMDPRDLPANNCRSNGLPSLIAIPDLQEWHVEGPILTIRYANFNTVRTVYLDGRGAAGDATPLGHSAGAWEGSEFVVTTTNLTAAPGGLGRNAPGSASRSYVEHYRLRGQDEVSGWIEISDPEYLTRDLRAPIALSRPEEGAEIPDVPCSVEASQRYLD